MSITVRKNITRNREAGVPVHRSGMHQTAATIQPLRS